MNLTKQQRDNLQKIAEASVLCEAITGCPAEVSAAQCIIESGWLKHAPGNNCFGIKDTDRFPETQYQLTKEYINGKVVEQKLAFEVYPTLADCFVDHAKLITGANKNCYAAHFNQFVKDGDLDDYIGGISAHYATAVGYSKMVKKLAHSPEIEQALANERLKRASI